MRDFIEWQDRRFQRAMRQELHTLAAERGLRLKPTPRPRGPRDVITIPRTVASEIPMTDSQRIITEVCAKHSVTRAELIGQQRSRPIAIARQEAAYRLKTETTMSLPQIGRRLGGRDHTTIIHSVRRHLERMRDHG